MRKSIQIRDRHMAKLRDRRKKVSVKQKPKQRIAILLPSTSSAAVLAAMLSRSRDAWPGPLCLLTD